jgi:hypothetical protein
MPPAGAPPVLAEREFAEEPLRIRDDGAGKVTGQPLDANRYGDLVLDAVITLEQGDEHDGYGLFVRQENADRYAAFIVSSAGVASVMILDGAPLQLAGGPIPDGIEFARGLRARNRITLLACGPCLVPFVNGVSLTGAMLDARYTGGYAGALLVPGGPGHESVAAVDWLQARAVLGPTGSPGSGPAPTG